MTRPPFDGLARHYDDTFTNAVIGGLMRKAVRRIMDGAFMRGDHILELGCGTGEDALYLGKRGISVTAVDASREMVDVAREKIRRANLWNMVSIHPVTMEKLCGHLDFFDDIPGPAGVRFQGVLSNFGALNCVADLDAIARGIADLAAPGAGLVACIMGPYVPWEWAYFGARLRFRGGFRRLARSGSSWRGIQVYYPSISRAVTAFKPHFSLASVTGIGFLVPPTYLEEWARKHPKTLMRLDRWERRLEKRFPFPWLADHYVLEMRRR